MLTDPKVKLRGKACYNIAVAHELMGDLTKAKDYARRATAEFGNKLGEAYARQLAQRIVNEARAGEETERLSGAE